MENGVRINRLQRGPWLQLFRNRRLEWTRADLPVPALPAPLKGLRLLHLSDPHFRTRWDPSLDLLLDRIRQQEPDLICLTGDFVEDMRSILPALPLVERFVAGLRARLGIYAVAGNHDGDLVAPRLLSHGVTLLDHRRALLRADAGALELIGLTGVARGDLDEGFLRSLPPKAPGTVRIALCHYPDTICRIGGMNADLYLTGHTHGGQVCLPGGIPIIRHDALPRRLCTGVHRFDDTWLVVSRGLGFSDLPIRTFCPAEVVEIVLTDAR